MKSINKTIAGICRRLRHLIGLTREKVAEETGLNLHDIVRAETGEENFGYFAAIAPLARTFSPTVTAF